MTFNISSISNGKAQALQPNSFRALLASLSSAGTFFGLASASFLLICSWPKLAVIVHPRKHIFLHTTASPLRRNLFRTVRTLLKEPESTFVHDCGVESVLFLHYLWSLFTLFGSTTLFITPSIACFNYFSQDRISPADKLNMLSWSNGSTKDAKRNWLYAILVPATTGFILCLTSKNLAQAVELRRAALATQFSGSGHTAPCKYFVVVKNVPSHWGAEKIREHYAPWRDHIVCVRPVSSLRSDSLAQLRSLVRHIEQLETLFINEMIQQSLQMDAAHFRRYLSDRMRERYSGESDGAKQSWRRTTEPMPALYARLEELTLSSWNKQIRLESSASASVLITLDDYYTARAIETHPRSVGVFQCRAHFLGSSASDVVYPNISYSWSRTEIRQGLVRTLTTGLIILWTFPMAIVGGLSQISVVLQLTPEWSSFQVSDWLLGAVQGVAPSLATSVLMSLFLRLLRILVEQAKHSTNTEAQLSTQSYYFCFFFIHLFLTASIASGLVPTTFEVLNGGIAEMPRVLALNLPLAGNYYLSYLLVQGILLAASTLFRPQALIQLYYATKPRITPRAKLTAMGNTLYEVRWGEIYPFYSILAVIAITYSVLTPFILFIATVTFGIAHVCFRYILLYLSDVKVETQGKLYFPALFNLFLGIYTYHTTMIGLFLLKFDPHNKAHDLGQLTVLLLTLFACTQYHIRLQRLYGPLIQHQEGMTRCLALTEASSEELQRLFPVAGPDNRSNPESYEEFRIVSDVTIWLPRDASDIATSLIREVRCKWFITSAASIQITDSLARVTNEGQVVFTNDVEDGTRFLGSYQHNCSSGARKESQ